MRRSWILAFVASLSFLGTTAQAFNPTCDAEATNRQLVGAAKTSFLKKCEKESRCETQASEKKLKGAVKNTFVKKCLARTSK